MKNCDGFFLKIEETKAKCKIEHHYLPLLMIIAPNTLVLKCINSNVDIL